MFDLKHEILRKLIHLSSFWIVAVMAFFPRVYVIVLLSLVAAFVLVAEYEAYKKKDSLSARIYRKFFGHILREKEKDEAFHYSGAPYVLVAALILSIVFVKPVAMFAMSILLLCDTMAALVGRAMGRHRLVGHKTWEGTFAFIATGMIVAYIFVLLFDLPILVMSIGVVLGALGDLYNEQLHVDDNLSIALLTALPFLI